MGVEEAEEIRAMGLRVRRMGEESSDVALEGERDADGDGETLRGRVRAQFSQGMARFRSASSYVLRKEESRRCMRGAIRGEAGGVVGVGDGG